MQTTVVGSYPKIPNKPRPARYRNALNKRDRGDITNEELVQVGNDVTSEIIQEQIDAGVDIVTDGQLRWDDDQTYVSRGLKGVKIGSLQRYLDTNTYFRETEITGAVGRADDSVLLRDWRFAQENSSHPVKAIVPGPYSLAAHSLDRHYNDRAKLALAFAEALRPEVEALANAGCKHIQVNDPVITFHKGDFPAFATAITRLLDGISGSETGVYTWFSDCTDILEAMQDLPVDVIGLDLAVATENWNALKGVNFSKKLGAGIVNARNTRMESPREVAVAMKRLEEFVPQDRIYVNPSCGLDYLPRETAFEKIKIMVEGARLAEGVPA